MMVSGKEKGSKGTSEQVNKRNTAGADGPSFSGWACSVHHDSIPVPIQRQQQVAVEG